MSSAAVADHAEVGGDDLPPCLPQPHREVQLEADAEAAAPRRTAATRAAHGDSTSR